MHEGCSHPLTQHTKVTMIRRKFIFQGKLNLKIIFFSRDWILVQQRIREHPDFDRWFVEYPEVRTEILSYHHIITFKIKLFPIHRTLPGWRPTCLMATHQRIEYLLMSSTQQKQKQSTKTCSTSSMQSRTEQSE